MFSVEAHCINRQAPVRHLNGFEDSNNRGTIVAVIEAHSLREAAAKLGFRFVELSESAVLTLPDTVSAQIPGYIETTLQNLKPGTLPEGTKFVANGLELVEEIRRRYFSIMTPHDPDAD